MDLVRMWSTHVLPLRFWRTSYSTTAFALFGLHICDCFTPFIDYTVHRIYYICSRHCADLVMLQICRLWGLELDEDGGLEGLGVRSYVGYGVLPPTIARNTRLYVPASSPSCKKVVWSPPCLPPIL